MNSRHIIVLLCASHIGWAQAEIYKHIDSEGNVTYTSTPMRGAKKLDLAPPLAPPSSSSRTRNVSDHTDFPRVDTTTQKNRDWTRHKILLDELAAEEKLLADARRSLKEVEEKSGALPGVDGKHDEKIKALKEQVSLHEKNVGALNIELSSQK